MAKPIDLEYIRCSYAGNGDHILGGFNDEGLIEFDTVLSQHDAAVLNEAADKIQALHPGEVKASVEFLRALAKEKTAWLT